MASFTYPAPDGEVWTPGQFADQIGRTDNLTRSKTEKYPMTVTAMAVAADGLSVEITIETVAELTLKEQALIGFALTR